MVGNYLQTIFINFDCLLIPNVGIGIGGESRLSSPATPPDKRVRIRRFEKLRLTETRDSYLIGPA